MQLHELQPTQKTKKRKRIGRGGKRGTYSGRGMKGQKSRSGTRFEPAIRGFFKRYHKLRGANKGIAPGGRPRRSRAEQTVNLDMLSEHFENGDTVSIDVLLKKDIIRTIKGRVPRVKILGDGAIQKKLTITDLELSQNAKEQIEKAGGTIT